MKRFCLAILTVVMIFLLVALPTTAAEKKEMTIIMENGDSYTVEDGDSVVLDSFEVELIRDESFEKVIKLYNGMYMHRFSKKQDIHTMLENALEIEYLVISGKRVRYKHIYEGKITNIDSASFKGKGWKEFYTYAVSPELIFDASVKVYNTYCLDGSSSHNGVYIYYATNNGDYVLYKEFLSYEEMYLFPLEDFYEVAKIVQDDLYLHRNETGGNTPISELVDLSSYVVTPSKHIASWIPYVATSIVAVLIVVGGCLIAAKRHKNAKPVKK